MKDEIIDCKTCGQKCIPPQNSNEECYNCFNNIPLNKRSSKKSIDWSNDKNVIIAIFVIILIFGLLISLKRDYGEKNYYPEEIPLEMNYYR